MFLLSVISRVSHIMASSYLVGSYIVLNYFAPADKELQLKIYSPWVHISLTVLLLSGSFNLYLLWKKYRSLPKVWKTVYTACLHTKILLGIAAFIVTSRFKGIHEASLVLMAVEVVLGGVLRTIREAHMRVEDTHKH